MELKCIYQGKPVSLGLDTETAELLLINAEGEVFFTNHFWIQTASSLHLKGF